MESEGTESEERAKEKEKEHEKAIHELRQEYLNRLAKKDLEMDLRIDQSMVRAQG